MLYVSKLMIKSEVQTERAVPVPNIPEMSEVCEPMAQALQ